MNGRLWVVLGAILAALAVGLGAFGAHGLESWVEANFDNPAEQTKRLENWQTASRYHLYHAFGLILIGLGARRMDSNLTKLAAILMLVGIALFSGCLYGWVLTGSKLLVMIVPLGGLAFIVAWLMFAIAAVRFDSGNGTGGAGK